MNIFILFHLIWYCNAAVLWWCLKRTCKEETVNMKSSLFFSDIFLIHMKKLFVQ